MKTKLYGIQDFAIQIAEAMAVMLQVDVEIIDRDHIRIAATGHFADRINQSNISDGHAYSEVLRTGKRLLVNEPAHSKYCEGCLERTQCEVRLEVGAPIILDDTIEGVIGLTCWKREREAFFLEHLDDSIYFLDQMCDLVSGKLKERISMQKHLSAGKMLHTLMRLVDKAIIMLDKADHLVEYNQVASKELRLDGTSIGKYVNVIRTGDTVTGKQEYKIIIGSAVHTVVGFQEQFDEQEENYASVLIFDSIREYRNQVYNTAYYVMPYDMNAIIGHSEAVTKLKREIIQAATNNSAVLIEGEEGSGKKVVGTAIWKACRRADKPFVYFNCTSVSEDLLEERLFGATSVSSAGMGQGKDGTIGVVEMANDGILYLDEIEELPIYYQAKLELVLEEKVIQRKGSFQKVPVNVRIIAATKKNLLKLIEKNKFRKPLYYMICVSKISVSSLRRRKEDIPDLVHYYIDQYTEKYRVYFKQIDDDVMEYLTKYNWYGNVTELEKTIEYMVNAMAEDGIMDMKTVPSELQETDEVSEDAVLTLEQVEQREIRKAMQKFGDTKKGKEKAAEALGIGIATLYRKLERM